MTDGLWHDSNFLDLVETEVNAIYVADKAYVDFFITNNFEISAEDIAAIYRHRWDIESFFKRIKQNIVIKHLWGYSENAVKTHLWVAICAYLVLALIEAEYKMITLLRRLLL